MNIVGGPLICSGFGLFCMINLVVISPQLHQRNEAFAHKKLAAQVLSDRVKELETELSHYQTSEEETFS